jgi:hypothetical protein
LNRTERPPYSKHFLSAISFNRPPEFFTPLDSPAAAGHNLFQFAIKQSSDNLFLYLKNPKNRFLGTVIVLIVF